MTEAGPSAGGRLILVVDDDALTCALLRDLCAALGHRVDVASDGDEALAHVAAQRPDLVLLDLMMPRRDGFAVLQALRAAEATRALPVIVLTAMGDMDGKIRGMELGADDYVTKPFKLTELQARIHAALTVRDYRERRPAAEEELSLLRAIDPLTGAGTFAQLKASLDAEVARSRRYGRPASLLLFGLEDYAGLRQQLGRIACDQLLADLAQAVRGLFRGADRLFRTDVEEFVVLLPETDLAGARVAASRLEARARELYAEGPAGSVRAALRVGCAVFPQAHVHSGEDL
ncbi:MAG TPA: response regulator, partial [Aggregicoccus sp.]|nr:response regulator [Aggregicoccus sp.]